MSKKSEEHYKNHPNDIPHSEREKTLLRKYNQLRHRFSVSDIRIRVKLTLLKEQIHADTAIKDMMIEMFPEEYDIALKAVFEKYGMMDRQEVRRAKIVKDWRIKPEKMPKW